MDAQNRDFVVCYTEQDAIDLPKITGKLEEAASMLSNASVEKINGHTAITVGWRQDPKDADIVQTFDDNMNELEFLQSLKEQSKRHAEDDSDPRDPMTQNSLMDRFGEEIRNE